MIQLRKFESQSRKTPHIIYILSNMNTLNRTTPLECSIFDHVFIPFSGSLPPISSNAGQPKIVASPADVIDNLNQASVWKPSSPAIILPINAFGQTLTPSIEKDAYPTNVSASIGRTAYLKCKIKNLGHKSV